MQSGAKFRFRTIAKATAICGALLAPSNLHANEWAGDLAFSADDYYAPEANTSDSHAGDGAAFDAYGCDACRADGCYSDDCCCGGCCCEETLAEGFMRRMTAMMESMQERGITYAPVPTEFYQGVASGGVNRVFEFGGKLDQFLILDFGKMGVWDGMTMTLHAETRYGEDVNADAVLFSPVNAAMLMPNSGEHDTAITGLSFDQALAGGWHGTFGKFNALDLFYQLYPQTGRGVNGFMNASMVIPISVARVAPLSFLGAGVMKMQGKQVQGALLVYDTNSIPTTSGFDELFDNGANILGYWRIFTCAGGLPGSHGFMAAFSTGEFTSFDPTGWNFDPVQGLVAPRERGAYTLLYFYEQTLWADRCDADRNIGLLSQWGLADESTSPYSWSANIGVQAKGLNRRRPKDSIGIGYFHTAISNDLKALVDPITTLQDVDGVEIYYNAVVGKMLNLTADFQVVEPAVTARDTAVVFGLRATVAR